LPLLVLEGIDKAGKATQLKFLAKRLTAEGYRVEHISFPDYETPLGKEIRKFLQGEIDLRPEVRQLLYVANRWERVQDLEQWLRKEAFVIADRYSPSGIAYGLANKLDLNWMLNLEEGLPTPEMVILVQISVKTSHEREVKKDRYERDEVFLEKVRNAYIDLSKKFQWCVVNGENSPKDVAREIWEKVSKQLNI